MTKESSAVTVPIFVVPDKVVNLGVDNDLHPVFDKTKILSLSGDSADKLIELTQESERCRLAKAIQKRLSEVEEDIKRTHKSRARGKEITTAMQFGERNALETLLKELLSEQA
jgi:hypothetical protein